MHRNRRLHASAAVLSAASVALTATMLTSASGRTFFDDDPVKVERDTQDASGMRQAELTLLTDLGYNLVKRYDTPVDARAHVNTIDEVADSSWFTNRIGSRPVEPAEVAAGPNTTGGPARGTWIVTASKSDGITPGFTVQDERGDRWFLKFDPPGYRAMTTGTEVAVSKLMWALGYHVPENHIAYLRPERLTIGKEARFTPYGGAPRRMRMDDVHALLQQADREPDGSYRVVASKALPGTPIGRIRFFGTRSDDPNDIVPHQHRRELRGYAVFAAWLNHVDAKAINSLDTLVSEGSRTFVRHHLIDFGSALGSAGVRPAEYWGGEAYLVEPKQVAKQMAGFGFVHPRWHTASFYESRSIGRFPAENVAFDPERWRPRVPNQAFLHARADDKFWAARKLAAMSLEHIRAALRAGQFGDEDAETFLVRALAERRTAIARTYLTALNPISDPLLVHGALTFTNAAVDADVAPAPRGYRAVWSTFDNATGAGEAIAETTGRTTRMPAPAGLPRTDGAFIRVSLNAIDGAHPSWGEPVDAYFRLRQGEWRLVGFERMPD